MHGEASLRAYFLSVSCFSSNSSTFARTRAEHQQLTTATAARLIRKQSASRTNAAEKAKCACAICPAKVMQKHACHYDKQRV